MSFNNMLKSSQAGLRVNTVAHWNGLDCVLLRGLSRVPLSLCSVAHQLVMGRGQTQILNMYTREQQTVETRLGGQGQPTPMVGDGGQDRAGCRGQGPRGWDILVLATARRRRTRRGYYCTLTARGYGQGSVMDYKHTAKDTARRWLLAHSTQGGHPGSRSAD